jgi:hypothetical protein
MLLTLEALLEKCWKKSSANNANTGRTPLKTLGKKKIFREHFALVIHGKKQSPVR